VTCVTNKADRTSGPNVPAASAASGNAHGGNAHGGNAHGAPTKPSESKPATNRNTGRATVSSSAVNAAASNTVAASNTAAASNTVAASNVAAGSARLAAGRASVNAIGRPASGTAVPAPRTHAAYIGETFHGDMTATSGGTPVLAQDGEPAGLARVTLAMQPNADKEPPAPRRLIGLCSWAAAIGILGAILAVWAGIVQLTGPPAWFLPTAGALGVFGVGLTVAAFFTARRRVIPWALLGLASCTLGAATYVIITAATPVAIA
jgi:hypothetical protein